MKVFSLPVTHPSFFDAIIRFFKIFHRYKLTSKKAGPQLRDFSEFFRQNNIETTFAVTAKVLERHPKLLNQIARENIELAIHGYRHIDYSRLSKELQLRHFEKAVEIFRKNEIPLSGFRFPYLRYNRRSNYIPYANLFDYLSNDAILWNPPEATGFPKRKQRSYQTMLNLYDYKPSEKNISLPRYQDNILNIPISLPDDDLLIDRLGIKDASALYHIWNDILKQTYQRGELFNLSVHPERFPFYGEAIEALLQINHALNPKIWVASLKSIHDWWKEKEEFRIEINQDGNDEYIIHAHCSKRASVLIKSKDSNNGNFFKGYTIAENNVFTIKSRKRPVIGVSPKSSPQLTDFLKNEGFIFETSSAKDDYSVFLEGLETFNEKDEMRTLQEIDHIHSPLIRFWRWPDRCRSALSISCDIDAFTSIDFLLRLFGH